MASAARKKRPGRPKLPPDEQLSVHINFRVSPREHAIASQRALSYGYVNVNEFARDVVLNKELVVHHEAGPIIQYDELVAALHRIGVNLNQIARHKNSGVQDLPYEKIDDQIDQLNAILDVLLP